MGIAKENYSLVHTESRSTPSEFSAGTARARFWGVHWGYTCQSFRVVTPGHSFSVGVPNSLHTQRRYAFRSAIWISFLETVPVRPLRGLVPLQYQNWWIINFTIIWKQNWHLKMWSNCCNSESPGKRACLLTISAAFHTLKVKCITLKLIDLVIGMKPLTCWLKPITESDFCSVCLCKILKMKVMKGWHLTYQKCSRPTTYQPQLSSGLYQATPQELCTTM